MSAVDLLEPILDDGSKRNNFFNGRLLSAEDLRAEQAATRVQDRHLASAIGDGVAWGLSVSILDPGTAQPQLRVAPGLALNRGGDLLHLANAADVTLVPATTLAAAVEGLFVDCVKVQTSAPLSGDHAYVFAIAPASGYDGTALVSDPNATALGRGSCGARYVVEGVKFRLIPIALSDLDGIDSASRARVLDLLSKAESGVFNQLLRNCLAHLCYGTRALASYFDNPPDQAVTSTPFTGWSILDAMRARGDLTSCDVPLAVVVLTGQGIQLLDVWSARRRVFDADAIDVWHAAASPRRVIEGEAAFLQFQAQLASLPSLETPSAIVASKYFDILPAGGWLPTASSQFAWRTFLGPHAPPETTDVDAALIRGVIEQSWFDEPFVLATDPPVPLHVYSVPGQPYVVFARSRLGAIRVRMTPSPPSTATVQVVATARTGAVTNATRRDAGTVIIPDLVPGTQTVTITAPAYQPVSAVGAAVVGGRTVDVNVALVALPKGWISVIAIDVSKTALLADLIGVTVTANGVQSPGVNQGGRWRFDNLEENVTYTVRGSVAGYDLLQPATATVTRGAETTVTLRFMPQRVPPKGIDPKQPDRCFSPVNARKPALGIVRVCMVPNALEASEKYYHEFLEKLDDKRADGTRTLRVADRREKVSSRDRRMVQADGTIVYTNPPWRERTMQVLESQTEMQPWLVKWAHYFATVLNDERVGKTLPIVYVDKRYQFPRNASEVPKSPAAYAVFVGDEGFGVPLIIMPTSGKLKGPAKVDAEVGKKFVKGLPPEVLERFIKLDLPDLDDIAWSWEELLVDITGDPPDVAGGLIIDAMKGVETINNDRTYLPGMDQNTKGVLDRLGYTDEVSLANADRNKLAKELGSNSLAFRLIESARGLVPDTAWSLDDTGLTHGQVEDLQVFGISSKGDVARAAEGAVGKQTLTDALGLANASNAERDQALDVLVGSVTGTMLMSSVALIPEASVAAWTGVSPSTATALVSAGYVTLDALGSADPARVASDAGIDPAIAANVVRDAAGASRSNKSIANVPGLSDAERTALNGLVGNNATIGAIASKSTTELAGALGSTGRAAVLIKGLTDGLHAGKTGMPGGIQ